MVTRDKESSLKYLCLGEDECVSSESCAHNSEQTVSPFQEQKVQTLQRGSAVFAHIFMPQGVLGI